MSGDVRGEPQRNLSLPLPTVRSPQSAWVKLHYLSFARLGICSSCPPQLPILISFYSLFTTVSSDNKQRQLGGSENTQWSYLLRADHPIMIRKSEVDNRTKDEEATLLSTGLVISSPLQSPQTLPAKPQGCDPQGGEAFAPGAPGTLRIFKSPVLLGRHLLF